MTNEPRVEVDWRGVPLLTLADRCPPSCRAVVAVLHPTVCGVQEGHHLHQQLGRQALRRILAALDIPATEPLDDALVAGGIGLVSVVKRPAGTEKQLTRGDVAHGAPLLVEELRARGIRLVVCPFEPAARALAGRRVAPGVHDLDGLTLARLAAPFAPAAQRDAILADVRAAVAAL